MSMEVRRVVKGKYTSGFVRRTSPTGLYKMVPQASYLAPWEEYAFIHFRAEIIGTADQPHYVRIEFEGHGTDSEADFVSMRVFVSKGFAVCEEKKACLKVMQSTPGEVGSPKAKARLAMRESNAMQLSCLQRQTSRLSIALRAVCEEWRMCLAGQKDERGRTHEARLKSLLAAAVGRVSNGRRRSGRSRSSSAGSPTNCVDPETTDPEGWDCNCYEVMQKKCAAQGVKPGTPEESKCFRALSCVDPRVCSGWKKKHCSASLPQVDQALSARSTAVGGSDRSSLDESLGHKRCS